MASQKSQPQRRSSGTITSSNTVNPFQFGQLQGNYANAQNVAGIV